MMKKAIMIGLIVAIIAMILTLTGCKGCNPPQKPPVVPGASVTAVK